jgi:hypothetical protein
MDLRTTRSEFRLRGEVPILEAFVPREMHVQCISLDGTKSKKTWALQLTQSLASDGALALLSIRWNWGNPFNSGLISWSLCYGNEFSEREHTAFDAGC